MEKVSNEECIDGTPLEEGIYILYAIFCKMLRSFFHWILGIIFSTLRRKVSTTVAVLNRNTVAKDKTLKNTLVYSGILLRNLRIPSKVWVP
jgi:hypothetical protein